METRIEVTVLRLGHRLVRDERISTHVGLVSRAFGAKRLLLSGADDRTADSIKRVSDSWGGDFAVSYVRDWRQLTKGWRGPIVHLTMYGERLDDALAKIRMEARESGEKTEILLVIGAEKVPREIYEIASYNVAVGNQPHSEVAALAVFLDRLFMGEQFYNMFKDARLKVVPSARGKKVVESRE